MYLKCPMCGRYSTNSGSDKEDTNEEEVSTSQR